MAVARGRGADRRRSDWRAAAARPGLPAVLAALAVVGVCAVAGFWWFDGYTLVQERYWQGIANDRPFQYWSWANLASVVCAIGLGSVAGIGTAVRYRGAQAALRAAPRGARRAAGAILFADLSRC